MYKNQKLIYAALMLMPIGVCVSCDSDDDDNESNNVVSGSATYVGVDLGLSVKWATCNLGSLNPEGSGNYYAWGETSPRIGSSWNYNWNTAPYYLSGNSSDNVQWSKYNVSDGKSVLDANDDVVKVKCGGNWRMPTLNEFNELKEKCTWTWDTWYGVKGYRIKGPSGATIFLPAAGRRNGSNLEGKGVEGYYWTSTLYTSDPAYAYAMYFTSGSHTCGISYRYGGRCIRPVCP